ncbi:MAG: deoxyribonuclease IV [Longimicrobiales bacterium]
MFIFGTHPVDNGGIHMAALRSANAGMTSVQIFTAIPKFYGDKSMIRPDRVKRFQETIATTKIRLEHVMVHAPYVLNVATSDEGVWARASAGLTKELERSSALGVGQFCFHPGSAMGGAVSAAAERVARAITNALSTIESSTRILVENTAGAGRTIGRTAAEIAEILRHVPAHLRRRTGYGLDTCHLFASGYNIAESQATFTAILDEFEQTIGEAPSFFHLNDSAGELGSNRDRHVLLGDAHIGTEPFRWLLHDRRARNVPLILETPQLHVDVDDEDPTGDPYDVRMFQLLTSLTPPHA